LLKQPFDETHAKERPVSTYITIDDHAYPTNTDEQVAAAREALREAGLESAKVYAGEPDGMGESYANGALLFAAESGV
jgi:hypothetical protein